MSAAFLPAMADRRPGTQLWSHESPLDTELSCMLWLSVGVDQMKLVPAFRAATTWVGPPETKFAHRAELPAIGVHERNGKGSAPRGGERPHPDPPALAANAMQWGPEFPMTPLIVGRLRSAW